MKYQGAIATTILLSGCLMPQAMGTRGALILKPQITDGKYSSQTVISAYTQASINHLILKLYTYDGTEHDQGIQKSIPNAQLTNSITLSNLKASTTYRIKAFAYASADESTLISTSDANSYTDVTLTNDDHPGLAALKVKLIDRPFNGQATASSIVVTAGGYQVAGSELMQVSLLGIVSTIAGSTPGSTDGVGTAALFNSPQGVALDANGNLYVADYSNHLIRKITPSGTVTTLAGKATSGYVDGTGTAALFNYPNGVAVDATGNVYVIDTGNTCVRKITPAGVVSTLAGCQSGGFADGTGTAAKFYFPRGIAVDATGNVYVGDESNGRVRKITSDGVVSTLASGLSSPEGLTVDSAGNVFVAVRDAHLIKKITSSGVVSTLAGSSAGYADGAGTAAKFNRPFSVTVDGLGNVFVADQSNNCIRKITSTGVVTTIAGGAGGTISGYQDGTGTAAKFSNPMAIVVGDSGCLYIGDASNCRIRFIR